VRSDKVGIRKLRLSAVVRVLVPGVPGEVAAEKECVALERDIRIVVQREDLLEGKAVRMALVVTACGLGLLLYRRFQRGRNARALVRPNTERQANDMPRERPGDAAVTSSSRRVSISYSTNDQEFADRLHADLQAKGVLCLVCDGGHQNWREIPGPHR
jgi:hypothetical protein